MLLRWWWIFFAGLFGIIGTNPKELDQFSRYRLAIVIWQFDACPAEFMKLQPEAQRLCVLEPQHFEAEEDLTTNRGALIISLKTDCLCGIKKMLRKGRKLCIARYKRRSFDAHTEIQTVENKATCSLAFIEARCCESGFRELKIYSVECAEGDKLVHCCVAKSIDLLKHNSVHENDVLSEDDDYPLVSINSPCPPDLTHEVHHKDGTKTCYPALPHGLTGKIPSHAQSRARYTTGPSPVYICPAGSRLIHLKNGDLDCAHTEIQTVEKKTTCSPAFIEALCCEPGFRERTTIPISSVGCAEGYERVHCWLTNYKDLLKHNSVHENDVLSEDDDYPLVSTNSPCPPHLTHEVHHKDGTKTCYPPLPSHGPTDEEPSHAQPSPGLLPVVIYVIFLCVFASAIVTCGIVYTEKK